MVGIYLKEKDWLDVPFESTMIKNIDEKKIIINRNYKFFVLVDLVLFLGNDENYLVVY